MAPDDDHAHPARRLSGALQDEVTSRLGRLIGDVPEDRLRQLMRTPLRRPVLDTVFWGLPRVLADTRTHEVATRIRCHVTGRIDGTYDAFWVAYADAGWSTGRGSGDREPELTVTVDAAELLLLAAGRSTPLQAYLAARLTMLLRAASASAA